MIEISDNEVLRLAEYMKTNYGINLEKKATLVKSRLAHALEQKNVSSLTEYMQMAMKDASGAEMSFLITKLTTNYTYFMREEQHFRYLKDTILPNLEKTVKDRDLRIWSAACSSGEEPYTIAMVIDEYFGGRKAGWDCKVLATDISQKVLAEAVQGKYPAESLQNIPQSWISRYFVKLDEETYRVNEAIRKEVIYRYFNLMTPSFPFKKKFHVIFCRNVMIYFDKETKLALMNKYYDFLEIGGHLIIGVSEPMGKFDNRFTSVMPSVYRKDKLH